MTDRTSSHVHPGPAGGAAEGRAARRAAALRANLARRKAQKRARDAGVAAAPDPRPAAPQERE